MGTPHIWIWGNYHRWRGYVTEVVSVTYRNVGRTQIRNKNRYLSEVKGALFLIVFYIVCKKKKGVPEKVEYNVPPPPSRFRRLWCHEFVIFTVHINGLTLFSVLLGSKQWQFVYHSDRRNWISYLKRLAHRYSVSLLPTLKNWRISSFLVQSLQDHFLGYHLMSTGEKSQPACLHMVISSDSVLFDLGVLGNSL